MDHRALKNFLDVIEHGSIGRAAEAAHMTQPALSKSIQRLEHELGVRLFERSASGTAPTAFGKALIAHAGAVTKDIQRLREHMLHVRNGSVGHAAIGAGSGILETLVADVTVELHKQHPNIRITAVAGIVEDLLPDFQRGRVDLLIGVRAPSFVDSTVSCAPFFKDRVGIVVREGHPLLRRRGLRLAELVDLHWVLPSPNHTFTKSCVACFASAGLMAPVPTVVSSLRSFIDRILSNTDYLSFMPLPHDSGHTRFRGLASLNVVGGTWAREMCLYRKLESVQSPAVEAVVDALYAACEGNSWMRGKV